MSKINGLTEKQLEKLVVKLNEEKQRLLDQDPLEENINNKEELADEVDMATADLNNSQIFRMRNREVFYMKKLDKALKKIESGEYGLCEDCGAEIKFQRLSARPTADLCIVCKEDAERDEMNNAVLSKSKSLGETFRPMTIL